MNEPLDIEIGGHAFWVPKWSLKEVLKKQNLITKLVAQPMAMLLAAGDDIDEGARIASLLEVTMDVLAEQDLLSIVPKILDGTLIKNEHGVRVPTTIDKMGELGVEFGDIIGICAAVIKHNYGAMLKNGFGETFEAIMNI